MKKSVFIDSCKDITGINFDNVPEIFSSTEYITLSCKNHGAFEILPYRFRNIGCPKCRSERKRLKGRNTKLSFIEAIDRARLVHEDFYDYSEVAFDKISDIVSIICPFHGAYSQRLSNHLDGQGCPACGKKKALSLRKTLFSDLRNTKCFLENEYLGDSIYSVSDLDSLNFNCPKHGSFKKTVKNIKQNQGCPKCSYENNANLRTFSENEFTLKNISVDGVSYSNGYIGSHSPSVFSCDIHGEFVLNKSYYANQKYGAVCPKCNSSNFEKDVISEIEKLNSNFSLHERPLFLNGKEIDVYFPDKLFGVEINGSYWHSDIFKHKNYHFEKTKDCLNNNIKLLHIWEHYWVVPIKRKIYISKISHFLGLDRRVYARKCTIDLVSDSLAIAFHRENHIEGFSIPYSDFNSFGLFFDNELVLVGSYGSFYDQGKKCKEWKLQRISTKLNTTVIGGITRITKHILNLTCDLTYQIALDNGGSTLLALENEIKGTPRYWWVNNKMEYRTRNSTQLNRLKLLPDFVDGESETEYMEKNKWFRVWDSGIANLKII